MHAVDLIRKKRDGEELTLAEIQFLVRGAATESIPEEQLAAWLMAAFLRGLSLAEVDALTTSMRLSGVVFDPAPLRRFAVDKHSTGGVGDKTSFLIAPIAAAAGLVVPMISGRALGHTGGTLDKLESIPGYRTHLSLAEMAEVLAKCGASIVGQTNQLVPADRVLYSLRDRTATVENPYLICASIMSKKLAAGLNGLVLDVKTGTGAFLRNKQDALFLAALMVEIGERAGTRTAALLTNMNQPLGRFAGNWIEIQESLDLLADKRHPLNEDLRELSLVLAGWMIFLGGASDSAEMGRDRAEQILTSGEALKIFTQMVEAQGGDTAIFDQPEKFHNPHARMDFVADRSGYLAHVDCTLVGWAVQRLGAGRERAGEPVSAHAGLEMHVKLGDKVEAGKPLCTLFADYDGRFAEPEILLRLALMVADEPPPTEPLIQDTITVENKKQYLENAYRP
ncbi:thymidine phosphorylase [Alloacidobacterium dinghuense]|uniref:thymidine phosphorylase n=1 Tax=Alloacidobacterium dinghuense TaxID=2763107 RepID=A0A7G8BL69_9BACT|nr:thymidine phosphorylase [Alloacidobacterium dinghuense]QNI33289.1 thymidine phosphorylase [Alloacidobacterium dinghuense]